MSAGKARLDCSQKLAGARKCRGFLREPGARLVVARLVGLDKLLLRELQPEI